MDALRRSRGTTLALVAIWTAVPLAGAFGGEIVTEQGAAGEGGGLRSRVPVVVPVAAIAMVATFFVTWFAYRAEKACAETGTASNADSTPVERTAAAPC